MTHPLAKSKNFGFNILKSQLALYGYEKIYFTEFLAAYNGDYWRASKGFLGPIIHPSATKMFKDRFISRNTIGEVVSTVSDAFLKSPNWYIEKNGEKLTDDSERPDLQTQETEEDNDPENPVKPPEPTPEEIALKDKKDLIDKVLSKFWEKHNLEQKLQKAFNYRLVCSRGGIRVYIPKTKKQNLTKLTLEDIRLCLDSIRIEVIEPKKSRMLDDEGDKFSIISYNKRLDYDTNTDVEIIEFSFVEDNGKTFIGVVSDKEEKVFSLEELIASDIEKREPSKKDVSTPFNLDSEPSFFEISGEPYVTQQFMELSSFLNLVLTLAGIAIFETGFQEIITTNTKFEYVERANPDTGKVEKVPVGLVRGGAMVQNFKGIEKINLETGVKDFADPKVTIKDPVPMDNFKLAKEIAYESILEEAGQQYKLISGDAQASAISRIQAMAGFYLRIKKYKSDIDALGSWVLTTILRFIGINPANGLDEYRVVFDSKIDLGPMTPEEKKFVLQMIKEGIISRETGRVMLQIDNPQLEKLLVEAEQKADSEKAFQEQKRTAELTQPAIPTT